MADRVSDTMADIFPGSSESVSAMPQNTQESIRALVGKQLAAFINVALARNDRGQLIERNFGPFFVFLSKTGLRPSEAIALAPSDVDLEKRIVRVEKVFASGRIRPYTKTGRPRTVDLSADLVDLLRTHIAELREQAFKDGKAMPPILFPSTAGPFIDWNNAVDAFHRMCRKAKIPRIAP